MLEEEKRLPALKIKISTLFMIIYCFIMFVPGYFSNAGIKLLSNLMMVVAAFFLLRHKYKPNKFIVLTGIYMLYLMIISYINRTNAADIHLIISYCKIFFFLGVFDYMLKNNQENAVNIMFYILLLFVSLDFFSIILFPNGLYHTSLKWNEWTTSQEAQWIYGNKNNRIYWYIMLLMTAWERHIINGKSKAWPTVIAIGTIVTMMLVKSSTATTVAIVVGTGILVSIYKKKEIRFSINSYLLVGICTVVTILILAGSTGFLKIVVEGIFHKDMTFSNRSQVWQQVVLLIAQKPFFGWGIVDSDTATGLLGSLTYVNAHNQFLNCLWQGGIVLICILGGVILCTARNINAIASDRYKLVFECVLVGLMIDMMFEVIMGTTATWGCLLLLNSIHLFLEKQEYLFY